MEAQVRQAIEAERQRLQAVIRKAQSKLEHIEAILADDEPARSEPPRGPRKTEAAAWSGNGSVPLRATIFAVLAAHPEGLRAKDMPSLIEAAGYSPNGKLTTRQLVYGELYRLVSGSKIARRGKKYYPAPAA